MSAPMETAVIFLGVGNLAAWGLIAADRLRTTNRRTSASKQPRAEAAADVAPATPAPAKTAKQAVARSTRNPGLAAYAASRDRAPGGHFLPVNGKAS